jgi:CheY-like chemotaxis protein
VSKRILLIDSDESFAQGLSSAITARGFIATLATNSEQGMTMAKQQNPDLIVVCVEAQPTNGYMLCTRLKKDEALKGIPVILTSANATPDSFEKHKKLKTRAEEYLIKPFAPLLMLEKASALLGVELPAEVQEDEIVAVEDEPLGLGDLVEGEDEPISLSEADAQEAHSAPGEDAVVVEEVEEVEVNEEPAAHAQDDDLDMFDKAFDSLGGPAVTPQADSTQRFVETPPAEEPAPEVAHPADEAVLDTLTHHEDSAAAEEAAPAAEDDVRAQLETRVAELEQALAERDAELGQAKKGAASSSEVLKLKEAKNKADKEVLRLKEELNAKEKELVDLQEMQTSLEGQAQQLKDDAVKREAAAKALQQRADALAAAAKKFERELTAAREEAKKASGASGKVADLEKANVDLHRKLEGELETSRHELEGLRSEMENLRTDLNAATGEKDLLSEEREELRKQLEEAQVTAVANEDRAVKAYQKIKSDEKLREKARKALEIAQQLLQENAADGEDADEASSKKSA